MCSKKAQNYVVTVLKVLATHITPYPFPLNGTCKMRGAGHGVQEKSEV